MPANIGRPPEHHILLVALTMHFTQPPSCIDTHLQPMPASTSNLATQECNTLTQRCRPPLKALLALACILPVGPAARHLHVPIPVSCCCCRLSLHEVTVVVAVVLGVA